MRLLGSQVALPAVAPADLAVMPSWARFYSSQAATTNGGSSARWLSVRRRRLVDLAALAILGDALVAADIAAAQ